MSHNPSAFTPGSLLHDFELPVQPPLAQVASSEPVRGETQKRVSTRLPDSSHPAALAASTEPAETPAEAGDLWFSNLDRFAELRRAAASAVQGGARAAAAQSVSRRMLGENPGTSPGEQGASGLADRPGDIAAEMPRGAGMGGGDAMAEAVRSMATGSPDIVRPPGTPPWVALRTQTLPTTPERPWVKGSPSSGPSAGAAPAVPVIAQQTWPPEPSNARLGRHHDHTIGARAHSPASSSSEGSSHEHADTAITGTEATGNRVAQTPVQRVQTPIPTAVVPQITEISTASTPDSIKPVAPSKEQSPSFEGQSSEESGIANAPQAPSSLGRLESESPNRMQTQPQSQSQSPQRSLPLASTSVTSTTGTHAKPQNQSTEEAVAGTGTALGAASAVSPSPPTTMPGGAVPVVSPVTVPAAKIIPPTGPPLQSSPRVTNQNNDVQTVSGSSSGTGSVSEPIVASTTPVIVPIKMSQPGNEKGEDDGADLGVTATSGVQTPADGLPTTNTGAVASRANQPFLGASLALSPDSSGGAAQSGPRVAAGAAFVQRSLPGGSMTTEQLAPQVSNEQEKPEKPEKQEKQDTAAASAQDSGEEEF